MNNSFLGAALLFAVGALASTGCAVQAGTESEIGTSESAVRTPSDPTDTTDTAADPEVMAKKKGGGGIPSNCTPNGGHDSAGGAMYYCKDADGNLHLCDEASIKNKSPGCTAALKVWWDAAAYHDLVELKVN